jgi:predicted TIM-barrel fold metal-dependent hydrolase
MQGKVALEEHFAIAETLQDSAGFAPEADWPELKGRLLDIQDRRLREMDAHGIEMMLLSLNAPAVQAIQSLEKADEIARRSNDFMAEQIARQPKRFAGLAALPMQTPELATRELTRCVKELGFCGALVNGFSQVTDNPSGIYYDVKAYWPFWAEVERLDVPFYLHPRNPLPKDAAIYEGHRWLLGPSWAFGQETAVHALRLMGSGLFDAHPALNIVIGHMGEGLPYSMWRIDNHNKWMRVQNSYPAKRKIGDYFRENFYITTSGNFRTQTLIDAMLEIGSDRILFSTDWPFENIDHASNWFDEAPISEIDRHKIGRDNAKALFKLG